MTTANYPADLANRDEYLDAKLRCAARVCYLAISDPLITGDFEPSEQWIAGEAENLRAILFGQPDPVGRYNGLRWHVLGLLGIRQSYQSSSARVEQRQPEAVADVDPAPAGSGAA